MNLIIGMMYDGVIIQINGTNFKMIFFFYSKAIHGYRETERQRWYPHNKLVINRVNKTAFKEEIMPYIHVLDLAADGVIKPHVDSARVIYIN